MRRPSAPFLAIVGILIGVIVMALVAPDHATDSPPGRADVPGVPTTATESGVDRSEARP
jgi:hypothetical protein